MRRLAPLLLLLASACTTLFEPADAATHAAPSDLGAGAPDGAGAADVGQPDGGGAVPDAPSDAAASPDGALDTGGPPADVADAGGAADAGSVDSGPDSWAPDDGGAEDGATPADAVSSPDASAVDAAPTDTGALPDGSLFDTGTVDAALEDAAAPDATPLDVTSPDIVLADSVGPVEDALVFVDVPDIEGELDAGDDADAAPPMPWVVVLEDGFDDNVGQLSGKFGWKSAFCGDPWMVTNGAALPKTDEGCSCGGVQCKLGFGGGCTYDAASNFITQGDGWEDLEVEVALQHGDDDALGVALRFEDAKNTWLVVLTRDLWAGAKGCDAPSMGSSLVRVLGGEREIVAQSPVTYEQGVPTTLRVRALGPLLTVDLDADGDGVYALQERILVHEVTEPSPHGHGFGLYGYQTGYADPACKGDPCGFQHLTVRVPPPLP